MKEIAVALLTAIQYIESRSQDGELDEDVAILETIAVELQGATEEELLKLKIVAREMCLSALLDDLGI